MQPFGLWKIKESGPTRLQGTALRLERDLESWIEANPALLEQGLTIVSRQLRLEAGPLDLLALDAAGRWVLIEIKRERLRREVVAQAIDYASCLKDIDSDWLRDQCDRYLQSQNATTNLATLLSQRGQGTSGETDGREIVIYLVGTQLDPGLERMVGFLQGQGDLSLRIVTFSAFQDPDGAVLLAREIHEADNKPTAAPPPETQSPRATEAVLALADQNGVGAVVRALLQTAQDLGFATRPYLKSLMFAPPANRTRCLFVVWVDRRQREPGVAKAYIATEAFEQFFGVGETELEAAVGPVNQYVLLDLAASQRISVGLKMLVRNEHGG